MPCEAEDMERRDKLLSLEEVGRLKAQNSMLHFAADASYKDTLVVILRPSNPLVSLSSCAAKVVDKLVHLLQKCSRLEGEMQMSNQTILSLLEQGADAKEIELAGGLHHSHLLSSLYLHTGQPSCQCCKLPAG